MRIILLLQVLVCCTVLPQSALGSEAGEHELLEGAAFLEQGRLEAAEEALRQSLQKTPDNVYALNQLGLCLLRQGRFEAATVKFRRVLTLDKGNSFARIWLGAMELRIANTAAANILFREVLDADPDNPDAHYFLGVILASEGQVDRALEHYQKAGANAPDDSALQCRLARAFVRLNMVDEAETAYRNALQVAPENGNALLGLGWLLYNQGQADAGMNMMRMALDVPETASEARKSLAAAANERALAFCATGSVGAAKKLWNEALQHDPGNRAARYYLRAGASSKGVCKAVGGLVP